MSKNKKAKFNPNKHIDIFGVRFCKPKGMNRIINSLYPELKGKSLDIKDLPKVLNAITSKKETETDYEKERDKKRYR